MRKGKEKKKTPREKGENYQKQKWKWKQKMFARGKHAPDKNKQNSLCISVFIIFPLGTFAQLELEGNKSRFPTSTFVRRGKREKSPIGQVSWRECQMSLCPVIYGSR